MNRELLVNRVIPILVCIVSVLLIVGAMMILYKSFNGAPRCVVDGHENQNKCATDLVHILKPLIDMNHPITLGRTVASYEDSIILHNTKPLITHLAITWKQEDAQDFFLELLSQKKQHRRMQYLLLDICYATNLFDNLSTLLIRMTTKEHNFLLSMTLNWLQQKQIVGHPSNSLYETTAVQCLHSIVNHYDIATLETLIKAGMKISKHCACTLLLTVVAEKKSALFIPILIQLGGNPNMHVSPEQSVLAYAINRHQYDTTQALLEAGATNLVGLSMDMYSAAQPSSPSMSTIRQLLITYNVIES